MTHSILGHVSQISNRRIERLPHYVYIETILFPSRDLKPQIKLISSWLLIESGGRRWVMENKNILRVLNHFHFLDILFDRHCAYKYYYCSLYESKKKTLVRAATTRVFRFKRNVYYNPKKVVSLIDHFWSGSLGKHRFQSINESLAFK